MYKFQSPQEAPSHARRFVGHGGFSEKMNNLCILCGAFIVLSLTLADFAHAQDSTRIKIVNLAESISGDVGVALKLIESGDTLSFHGRHPFPMQSVYKFPLAMAVLHQVDLGKLSLTQKVHLTKDDYFDTHSPLRDKYPAANVDVTLEEILGFTVAQSDNIGCDLLFKFLGGPKKVDQYAHHLGIKDIAILNTERELAGDFQLQFQNWSTPWEMAKLLEIFAIKKPLSESSQSWLTKAMIETTVGLKRIRGKLPEGTFVAHRTGTGGTSKDGWFSVVNDVGIVTLPDGRHLIIVVYVTGSHEGLEVTEDLISSIAKIAFDRYAKR